MKANKPTTGANLKEMKVEIRGGQEEIKEDMLTEMDARREANNEKFKVLRNTLVSRMTPTTPGETLTRRK
jgi:hypothetical protein